MIEQLYLKYANNNEALYLITNYKNTVLAPYKEGNYYINEWRSLLRFLLYLKREGRSDVSGTPLSLNEFQLHEGIIPRTVVSGVKWGWMIHHEYNVFLLSPEEHIPNPPSRKECYEISCQRYGKSTIDEWISSLPFKVRYSI